MSNEIQKIKEQLIGIVEAIESLAPAQKQPTRWKPEKGEWYYSVVETGDIVSSAWNNFSGDERLFKAGNCFSSFEEAQRSRIYKAFNTPYEYWIPGIDGDEEKPDERLDGLEAWSGNEWCAFKLSPNRWKSCTYRWKKQKLKETQ